MKEKLIIRCDTKDVYEPYIKNHPSFNRKWLAHNWELVKVIEGYLDDSEFREFFDYLRTKVDYEISYIKRKYTEEELFSAQLLTLKNVAAFEPTGEMCGTEYAFPCHVCWGGRTVKGTLFLDLRKVPRRKDIARTIAGDEWIVSGQLAQLLVQAKLAGFDLRPVQHKARYEDDAINLAKYPSGREMIKKAAKVGVSYPTQAFIAWMNSPEQAELNKRVTQEHVEAMQKREKRKRKPFSKWSQLLVVSAVKVDDVTRYGVPFQPVDDVEKIKSPCGHAIKDDILSELYIKKKSWDGSDIVKTNFYFGTHLEDSVGYPSPEILISQRFYRLLKEHNIKGYEVEVAHLV